MPEAPCKTLMAGSDPWGNPDLQAAACPQLTVIHTEDHWNDCHKFNATPGAIYPIYPLLNSLNYPQQQQQQIVSNLRN